MGLASPPTHRPLPAKPLVADGRHRQASDMKHDSASSTIMSTKTATVDHPSGREALSLPIQILRAVSLVVYFSTSILVILITLCLGVPLYWINRDLYYSYIAYSKQTFAIVVTLLSQIWAPSLLRISGDASVAHQMRYDPDGRVEFDFSPNMVLIANHQIYTDWSYLWWVAYSNRIPTHGRLYIILKESLMYVPVIGFGMWLYGFVFMSRKMAVDQPRLRHRLKQLQTPHQTSSGQSLDPMWLLLFPEGTNLCAGSREKSLQWAAKQGISDPAHVLLPRSTGTFFCLNELKNTVEYVYDCTMAYEGIPRGRYGEEFFSLTGISFKGQAPKSANMYWRRYRLADMPLDDAQLFDTWLRDVWYEKDKLIEGFITSGRFPATEGDKKGYIETWVKPRSPLEFLEVFLVLSYFVIAFACVKWIWTMLLY